MKRQVQQTTATCLIDNTSSGARQTVILQVLGPGTVFVSTQPNGNDLNQVDSTNSPVNGLRLTQVSSIEDGKFRDFLGHLWVRADQPVDIDVTIHNSPQYANDLKKRTSNIAYNAPNWSGHHNH